jgi:hypothetical protein
MMDKLYMESLDGNVKGVRDQLLDLKIIYVRVVDN